MGLPPIDVLLAVRRHSRQAIEWCRDNVERECMTDLPQKCARSILHPLEASAARRNVVTHVPICILPKHDYATGGRAGPACLDIQLLRQLSVAKSTRARAERLIVEARLAAPQVDPGPMIDIPAARPPRIDPPRIRRHTIDVTLPKLPKQDSPRPHSAGPESPRPAARKPPQASPRGSVSHSPSMAQIMASAHARSAARRS